MPLAFSQCCGRYVDDFENTPAGDAESLMRSRYTAFVLERADYLLATWHPTTRPASIDFEPGSFEDQRAKRGIICGTPKLVLQELRVALEKLRPGIAVLWDGDGAMTHDDAMRSLRLIGEEILPRMREWAKELDLPGPFEVDPATGEQIAEPAMSR